MLFDSSLMFWKVAGTNSFTAGEFVSLAGVTSSISSAINLGNARDLGVGEGSAQPMWVAVIGSAFTSSVATQTISLQFLGSTNNSVWTTYSETGYTTTVSFAAGKIFTAHVPQRPPGVALPQYYAMNVVTTNQTIGSISTGTIIAGIVLNEPEGADTMPLYPAGFTVA